MGEMTLKACEGCGTLFETDDKRKRFHDAACAKRTANDRARGKATVEEKAEASLERRLLTAQAATKAARREASAHMAEAESAKAEADRLLSELSIYESPRRRTPSWLRAPRDTKVHHATLLAPYGDWHYGEVVRPGEMGGYNAYDMAIAEKRTSRYFERVILVSRQYLAGVKYDGVVMPLLGDLVSGDIHDELVQTNELSTNETILTVEPWLAAGIEMFREEYGQVHVPSVPGNHGRNSRKPRYKRRSANNADTLIARLLARRFQGVPGVTFDIPEGMSVDFSIYGTNLRAEHGDEAHGGSGIQAALAPLMLRVHRIRKQAQAEGRAFDALLVGHWHQIMSLPAQGLLANGTAKGYDEYARGKGFAPEPPGQLLTVITPEHGITIQTPIYVSKRANEGW